MKAIEKLIGKKVIIRSDRAGVFFGTLNEVEPTGDKYTVELTECRRLWFWSGASSLSQLAMEGVKNPESCKFTVVVNEIVVAGVIEIIPCSDKAVQNINNVSVWKRR